jgi:hypothetical protein
MEVDLHAGKKFKAEKDKFQVDQTFWGVLDKNDGVVGVLQVRDETPPGIKCGTTPWMCPASLARTRIASRASATKSNNRGEIGSPCLTPLLLRK